MTTSTGVAPITRAEVAALYELQGEDVREALEDCLALLADLYQRHTGSMFNVNFPDEEVALKLLDEAIETLKDVDPFWQRMVQAADAYLALRAMIETHGPIVALRERAQAAVDQLVEQWTLLTRYPALVRTAGSLAQPALRTAIG